MKSILRFYHSPEVTEQKVLSLCSQIGSSCDGVEVETIDTEACFYVVLADAVDETCFVEKYGARLCWLLGKPIGGSQLTKQSTFAATDANVIEIGPRLTFTTAFSTNAVSACRSAGLDEVVRLEKSIRYRLTFKDRNKVCTAEERETIIRIVSDRMTECEYKTPPSTFDLNIEREEHHQVDLMGDNSIDKLRAANDKLGLAFDEDDIVYYHDLFTNRLKRNPTDVELFDLAQSNSEHSRHWFFKGRMIVDGCVRPKSLFKVIQETQQFSNPNSVIAFCDNSSALAGADVENFVSCNPTVPAKFEQQKGKRHLLYTAETHNFPTAVCPFPGATTGTGGRIRDVHATGRGAHEIAGVAGYSFGNLQLPGYNLPWEDDDANYPSTFAHPREVAIQASNGASDYGNKFGEPVVTGFARSFGQNLAEDGSRREYVKPIMFSGGIGSIDDVQLVKHPPTKGLLVAKIGGPIYRIGVGGGAASSVQVQGGDKNRVAELDFGAVQRGDAEMEQKVHRVIRACVERGDENPIMSIHDQGAGGNGNVLKELVEGVDGACNSGGALFDADSFSLGDPTISIRELWGAEYQESDAALIHPERIEQMKAVCERERCPLSVVGTVSGDNRVVLRDFGGSGSAEIDANKRHPVDFDLATIASRDPKEFHMEVIPKLLKPLCLPDSLTTSSALDLVLRLPSVASKRYLTNKVDRSVTGLIAQQQCVGPLHTPLADVGVVALSYFDTVGGAVAVGEQPVKGLICAEAGARMSVGEALTNLVFAPITHLKDVKCSGNWMWAAKLPGEGAELIKACDAMCSVMRELGVAVDGGKDSLSMAAQVDGEIVKAPGTLVISAYACCKDITRVLTPDLKGDSNGTCTQLIYVRFGTKECSVNRLGGTALAQCLKQIGNESPDLDCASTFTNAFNALQEIIVDDSVSLLSGHDVSDGGLICCFLEMAFAGNMGVRINVPFGGNDPIQTLFAEELGVVLETSEHDSARVLEIFNKRSVCTTVIGSTTNQYGPDAEVSIAYKDANVLKSKLVDLRSIWEATSYQLELLQTDPKCAKEEQKYLAVAGNVPWKVNFDYSSSTLKTSIERKLARPPSVAIIREEGSNGDREMGVAFHLAGFEVWDVTMSDLLNKSIDLEFFKGIAFVGGFSYADVLGSAKGWASAIKFHSDIAAMFERFRQRPDTFSLGVCNGCQLMALLGWVGNVDECSTEEKVLLDHNECGRFQSCFSSVEIGPSPAIMLQGMHGSLLGVWSSHGEGRFTYKSDSVLDQLSSSNLVPLRYVDYCGSVSEQYPTNPNGSKGGVAALCSMDGRHLAMMPHPDRSFLSWQWPHWPRGWPNKSENDCWSPWMKFYRNAFDWVEKTTE